MAEGPAVRFKIFGEFRAFRNGLEITDQLPDNTYLTYLKMLVLSGDDKIGSSNGFSFKNPKRVSDLLYKANNKGGFEKYGQYDFAGKTGLAFRYSTAYGVYLESAVPRSDTSEELWTSDLKEFEKTWEERSEASDEAIEAALKLYGTGVTTMVFAKNKAFLVYKQWIEARLKELKAHRADLQQELERRQAEVGETVDVEGSPDIESTPPERALPQLEESGGANGATITNTSPDDQTKPTVMKKPTALTDVNMLRGYKEDPMDEVEQRHRDVPIKVSAIGVLVLVFCMGLTFFIGKAVGSSSVPPTLVSQSNTPVNVPKSNRSSVAHEKKLGDSKPTKPADDEAISTAVPPENPVALPSLYAAAGRGAAAWDEHVLVIGGQLFENGYFDTQASGRAILVFNVDKKFNMLKCVLGISDAEKYSSPDEQRKVEIGGDGKWLYSTVVEPGVPHPVKVSIAHVKALSISFQNPVMVIDPRVWR